MKKYLIVNDPALVHPKIIDRYVAMLQCAGFQPIAHGDEADCFHGEHLFWMLVQIAYGRLSSKTKAHRWLGFVQAGLVVNKLTTVNTERDFTRPYFLGD